MGLGSMVSGRVCFVTCAFSYLRTSAHVSFIVIFSHSPKYMVVFSGVFAGLEKFLFVMSTRWQYWFWFGGGTGIGECRVIRNM